MFKCHSQKWHIGICTCIVKYNLKTSIILHHQYFPRTYYYIKIYTLDYLFISSIGNVIQVINLKLFSEIYDLIWLDLLLRPYISKTDKKRAILLFSITAFPALPLNGLMLLKKDKKKSLMLLIAKLDLLFVVFLGILLLFSISLFQCCYKRSKKCL